MMMMMMMAALVNLGNDDDDDDWHPSEVHTTNPMHHPLRRSKLGNRINHKHKSSDGDDDDDNKSLEHMHHDERQQC